MIVSNDMVTVPGCSAVERRIVAEIEAAWGDDPASEQHDIRDVARAIGTFVEEQEISESIESDRLRVLICRALRAVGKTDPARRVLVFGSGLVRKRRSEVAEGKVVWVLDFGRLGVDNCGRLEIVLFRCLSAVLDAMACVWEDSGGRGVLGLRHLRSTVESILGRAKGNKQVDLLATEIKTFCTEKLERLQRSMEWVERPLLMEMDPGGG